MPTYAGMSGEKLLVFLLGLAAELLELGEYGGNIEVAAAGLVFGFGSGRGDFRFLARGGFRGGQQSRSGVGRRRLILVGAVDLEIEVGLRGKPERHRVHRRECCGVPVGAVADSS